MNAGRALWRRLAAMTLLGTLPALAVTIPILDLIVGDGRPAVETHHHPGTHGFPHNHLICIQQQANQWAPSGFNPTPRVSEAFAPPEFADPAPLPFVASIPLHHPRAPPTA